jgi:hypothetical protein
LRPALGHPASAGLFYSVLSIVVTWPLVLGLATDVPGDLGDSLLNMWILAWGAEHLPRLLTAQIGWTEFCPEPLSFALSEHLIGQTLQILPIYWLTGNIILCYNLLFLSTFALSAFGTYLLVRDLTGSWRAALIAGLIYGFLPYRIASIPHLQVLSSQWMPLAMYGLNRWVTSGSIRALAGGTAALVMQNWSCGYYLLYFAPFLPLFLLHRMWTVGTLRALRVWYGLIAAAAATLVLTIPLLTPYQQARDLFGFERSLGEVYYFSASIWSYFTASENVWLYGKWLRAFPSNEQETFLGFMPWLLLLIGLLLFSRATLMTASTPSHASMRVRIITWLLIFVAVTQFVSLMSVMLFGGFEFTIAGIPIRARTPARLSWQFAIAFGLLLAISRRARVETARIVRLPISMAALLTMLAIFMSFGPNYGLYGFLYEHVPGFNGVRVPARYAMIAGLFLAVLAGFAAARIFESARWRLVLVAVAVLVLIEGFAAPIEINRNWGGGQAVPPDHVVAAANAPPVYRRIRELSSGSAITEFPFGDPAWEIRYTYYAASHWKPITNGYSGNFPRQYKERVARLQAVAKDPEGAWQSLKNSGTTHVIIHRNAFANFIEADTVESWLKAHGAKELARFPDNDILLSIN